MAHSSLRPRIQPNNNPPAVNVPAAVAPDTTKIKFPEFISTDITLYFLLVDRYFTTKQILTESDRFDILSLYLPQDVLSKCRSLIINKPDIEPYSELKQFLIKTFSGHQHSRFSSLINNLDLGNSATYLLQEINKLSDDLRLSDEVKKNLIFSKLPHSLQLHMIDYPRNGSITDFCSKVDDLLSLKSKDISSDKLDLLTSSITDLKFQIHDLSQQKTQFNRIPFDKSQNSNFNSVRNVFRNNSNFQQVPSYQNDNVVCNYHARFGRFARNCIPPCKFSKNEFPSRMGNSS